MTFILPLTLAAFAVWSWRRLRRHRPPEFDTTWTDADDNAVREYLGEK